MSRIASRPVTRALLALLVSSVLWTGVARASGIMTDAHCAGGTTVSLHWMFFYESPAEVTAHPEWIGHDILRRSVADCGAYERVNEEPYPRLFDLFYEYTIEDAVPAAGTLYEYKVIPVDAGRNQLSLSNCFPSCVGFGHASCPDFSVAVTHGFLQDLGWTLIVNPCPDGCYPAFYLTDPWPPELNAYAGTDVAVKLFGSTGCGGFEGCSLTVDHYQLEDCAPVQALGTSWGRVKKIYR